MRKALILLAGFALLAVFPGCTSTGGEDQLPSAAEMTTREYYDPWNGVERQYHGRDATHVR
jgi:hypothetical protein